MTEHKEPRDRSREMHTGYDVESGLLARVREWTDVFPWLRLVRTLRVAGSPVMVALVALTFLVWWGIHSLIVASPENFVFASHEKYSGYQGSPLAVRSIAMFSTEMIPVSLFFDRAWEGNRWLEVIWALLVWMPVTLYLVRQGALLTAGRELVSLESGMRRSFRLVPTAWLMAVVPLACILVFAMMILAFGWLSRSVEGVVWLEAPLAFVIVIIALPCGILGLGAYVAVPLGWAALANEKDPDALDSLSRGYEYLYRRPLHVVGYLLLSFIILCVIALLAAMIALVADAVVRATFGLVGVSELFAERTTAILAHYPIVVTMALFWALVGGVYLLLRHDAGEQQVEDIWQPTPPTRPPLPQLSVPANADK